MARATPPEVSAWVEVVVTANSTDLLRYLRRRVESPEDAADLLGHVLLALWEKGARVPTSELDARMWCFSIARNVLREHYRHAVKRIALADRLRSQLRDGLVADNAADATLATNDRDRVVRQAIRSLDERSRELVMLVHWDGLSIAEAARLLSINESTARTSHARALKRLERTLPSVVDVVGPLQTSRTTT